MTSTVDIDKRIDEILKRLCMDYNTNHESLKNDWLLQTQATDLNKAVAKELISTIIREVAEQVTPSKVIAVEYDEKYDHNDGNTHATPDYALGWNDCISEQRTKLNNLLGKEK